MRGAISVVWRLTRVEQSRMQREGAVETACPRVHQQLRGVEAVAAPGLPGALHTQPIARAGLHAEDVAVMHCAGAAGQAHPRDLAIRRIEDADMYRDGVRRRVSEVRAGGVEGRAQRLRQARRRLSPHW
jgi:hypothetical protein